MQAFLWQLARNSLVLWINRVKEHEDSWRACDVPSIETRKLKKRKKKKACFQQQRERQRTRPTAGFQSTVTPALHNHIYPDKSLFSWFTNKALQIQFILAPMHFKPCQLFLLNNALLTSLLKLINKPSLFFEWASWQQRWQNGNRSASLLQSQRLVQLQPQLPGDMSPFILSV